MQNDRIYYKELQCYKTADRKNAVPKESSGCYDLSLFPEGRIREEMKSFIFQRGKEVSYTTILHDKTYFNQLALFMKEKDLKNIRSFLDKTPDQWIRLLKGWMIQKGIKLTYEKKNIYGTSSVIDARLIQYLKKILHHVEPPDERDEVEKDIWKLDALEIEIRHNPIYNVQTVNFQNIIQPDIRSEVKKIVYLNLQYEAVGTVLRELTAMRKFSAYLHKEWPDVQSCSEIDRDILEGYLISQMTDDSSHRSNSDNVLKLRNLLEGIGKLYQYSNLETLFLNTDIPPEIKAEFKVYSDKEMQRLNAHIAKLDEQIARWLIIHQMLGTRVSDTSTLRCDCLYQENGQDMIQIHQVKTRVFQKPVRRELASLIQKALEYTREKYGETKYIFVDEKSPKRPLQYTTIKHKVMGMILKEDLKDDNGELFHFGTHLFRHYYGVKLTEMHLDDWTIARLLGHKRLGSVQHYRKMSNQRMADETREVRNIMTDVIYQILDGWGEEYEQIRPND